MLDQEKMIILRMTKDYRSSILDQGNNTLLKVHYLKKDYYMIQVNIITSQQYIFYQIWKRVTIVKYL